MDETASNICSTVQFIAIMKKNLVVFLNVILIRLL